MTEVAGDDDVASCKLPQPTEDDAAETKKIIHHH